MLLASRIGLMEAPNEDVRSISAIAPFATAVRAQVAAVFAFVLSEQIVRSMGCPLMPPASLISLTPMFNPLSVSLPVRGVVMANTLIGAAPLPELPLLVLPHAARTEPAAMRATRAAQDLVFKSPPKASWENSRMDQPSGDPGMRDSAFSGTQARAPYSRVTRFAVRPFRLSVESFRIV